MPPGRRRNPRQSLFLTRPGAFSSCAQANLWPLTRQEFAAKLSRDNKASGQVLAVGHEIARGCEQGREPRIAFLDRVSPVPLVADAAVPADQQLLRRMRPLS